MSLAMHMICLVLAWVAPASHQSRVTFRPSSHRLIASRHSRGADRIPSALRMKQHDDCALYSQLTSRRSLLATVLAALSVSATRCASAEEPNPLWPRNGLFPDCPTTDTCVSSQDDRPQCWDNPWVAEGEPKQELKRLRRQIESSKLGGRVVSTDGERYIRAEFEEKGPFGGIAVDDAEFFFAPNDTLIQFRAERRGDSQRDFGANKKRLEELRIALRYEKVPVPRNRRRALLFFESPLDTFGPATYEKDDMGFTNRDFELKQGERKMSDAEYNDKTAPNPLVKFLWQQADDRVSER